VFNVVAELLVTLKADRDVIASIMLQLSNSIIKLIQIIKMEMEIDAADNNGNTCCFVKFFRPLTGRVTHFYFRIILSMTITYYYLYLTCYF